MLEPLCLGQSLPVRMEQSTVFQQRTMASDLEVLTLITPTLHSATVQTTPVRAEGHGLMKPTEPHHLQRAEMQF